MHGWTALATDRVDEKTLRAILARAGTSWEDACHVTATSSLARVIRESGVIGLPIATVTDLIVMSGTRDAPMPISQFPPSTAFSPDSSRSYEDALLLWQASASGRRLRTNIKFDDELRAFARSADARTDTAQLLVKSRREFFRTISSLISSGVHPDDLLSESELGKTGVEAWRHLERHLPSLTAVRDDLWMDIEAFQAQSTNESIALRHRVVSAFERAYGPRNERRVVVHHGFYFFTPPQWALFQLLRQVRGIEQVFIVHDDGGTAAFETWRRFFTEKWSMPALEHVRAAVDADVGDIEPGAAALKDALRGEPVVAADLQDRVAIVEIRSPAELVRHWRSEENGEGPGTQRYAAQAKSVERFVRRLGRDPDAGRADLAQLPVGAFLLAVHDCIRVSTDRGTQIVLTDSALLDIATSGYLNVGIEKGFAPSRIAALRRALPFFRNCEYGWEWQERAKQLHRLIVAEVSPLGARVSAATDVDRIDIAASNPLRLVPWADLEPAEAAWIDEVIVATVALVTELAARERVSLKDHMGFLREKLALGMRNLGEKERLEVSAKIDGFSISLDDEIDIEGLVDVVAMLLGRTAEFDDLSELEDRSDGVNEIRGLDVLGFHKSPYNLHITNLAEGTFPGRVSAIGWPFHEDDLALSKATIQPISMEILLVRAESAALSDLYLLWLALDGVQTPNKVTFSWVSELEGQYRSPSSLLSLLSRPMRASEAILQRTGGLPMSSAAASPFLEPIVNHPQMTTASVRTADGQRAIERMNTHASAATLLCARRLAIQWILGPSPAFQAEHHQAMLHGAVHGALVKAGLLNEADALRLVNDLWRHLTPGQRASSRVKSAVQPNKVSAKPAWIYTLKGSEGGEKPFDHAYKAALNGVSPEYELAVPPDSSYLPPGVDDPDICNECPVRLSCLVWTQPPD